jgi:hypothetical protein
VTALSTAADVARIAFDIIAGIWPTLEDAIRGGTQRDMLEAALRASIAATERAALLRVQSRAGRTINPLRVLAIQLDDLADELALHDQLDDARTLRTIAENYRKTFPAGRAGDEQNDA